MRAEVEVSGGEAWSLDVALGRDRRLQGVHDPRKAAVAGHALLALVLRLGSHGVGSDRRFHRSGGEEQPAVIAGALGRSRRQPGFRAGGGRVGADGGAFSHNMAAVSARRHLATEFAPQILSLIYTLTALDTLYPVV